MRPNVSIDSIKIRREIIAKDQRLIVRPGGEKLAKMAVSAIVKRT